MDWQTEQKLKEEANQATANAKYADQRSGIGLDQGQVGGPMSLQTPGRDSLRNRVEAKLNRANGEARKVELLHELQHLLQKNPEVARILDLLDEDLLRGV